MNNITTARRRLGISGQTLADQLNVTRQQVTNWESGFRNPSRAAAQEIANVLDVDIAWIMDCAQPTLIMDPIEHIKLPCHIMRSEAIEGYGLLQHVVIDETGDVVAVLISDDIVFTTTDWQGAQPVSAEEIADFKWMDSRGVDAIMLNGLPRVFV